MSQTALKKSLKLFLEMEAKEYLAHLTESNASEKQIQEFKEHHQQLMNFLNSHGLCFGMAVASAAMDQAGQTEMWKKDLIDVSTWDKQTLTTELRAACHRLLNYIIPSHTTASEQKLDFSFSHIRGMKQKNLLNPLSHTLHLSGKRQSFLEISILNSESKKYEVKTIQQRAVIGGYFTKEQLVNLLDEKMVEGNICLIHSVIHGIHYRFDAKKNKHIIFESNYKNPICEKAFSTKEEAIAEILRKNTSSLVIEIASLDSKAELSFPSYHELLKTSGDVILSDEYIFYRSEISRDFFTIAEEKEYEKVRAAITTHLFKVPHFFEKIITIVPENVDLLLKLAEKNKDIFNAIQFSMLNSKEHPNSLIKLIVDQAPEAIPRLIKLNIIDSKNQFIFPPLSRELIYSNPQILKNPFNFYHSGYSHFLFTLAEYKDQDVVRDAIIFHLHNTSEFLEDMINKVPQNLVSLVNLAEKNKNIMDALMFAIVNDRHHPNALLKTISTKSPEAFDKLKKLKVIDSEQKYMFPLSYKELFQGHEHLNNEWLFYRIEVSHFLFTLAQEPGEEKICTAIINHLSHTPEFLKKIIESVPENIILLIKLAEKNSDILNGLLKSLISDPNLIVKIDKGSSETFAKLVELSHTNKKLKNLIEDYKNDKRAQEIVDEISLSIKNHTLIPMELNTLFNSKDFPFAEVVLKTLASHHAELIDTVLPITLNILKEYAKAKKWVEIEKYYQKTGLPCDVGIIEIIVQQHEQAVRERKLSSSSPSLSVSKSIFFRTVGSGIGSKIGEALPPNLLTPFTQKMLEEFKGEDALGKLCLNLIEHLSEVEEKETSTKMNEIYQQIFFTLRDFSLKSSPTQRERAYLDLVEALNDDKNILYKFVTYDISLNQDDLRYNV